jgi:signal transduction histidine kinase
MKRGILQGIGLLRWLALVMLGVTILVTRHTLSRSWLAYGLAGAALLVTLTATSRMRSSPLRLLASPNVALELFVGAGISLADGWSYKPGHAFSSAQSLGGAWPLAGVLTAGVAWGPLGGGIAGVVIGGARAASDFANGVPISGVGGSQVISMVTTTALYVIAGAVVGRVAVLLDRSERTISAARARDEVARTLHDGVLQTLAIVERSTADPALARLAREQERSLRDFLWAMPDGADREAPPSSAGGPAGGCAVALRRAAGRFETTFGGRVSVIVADDVPALKPDIVAALAGAVGEALTNAGKHGEAQHVTVYMEPETDKRVFCSIKDDGSGFDVQGTPEGFGISNSIRARITEVGGKVEIDSNPGQGTEIRLWVGRGGRG